MDEKALGRKLQLARKRAGLTQQELCQKAGLSYSTLAKIERGAIKSPSVFTVASIASATGTNIEDLLDITARGLKTTAPVSEKKVSKTGVRFVYFDIDGVLIHYFLHAFTAIAHDTAMAVDVVENIFYRYNDAVCRGQISMEQFNQSVAKDLGLGNFDWQKYYLAAAEPIAGIGELLKWTALNYEVGLLGNHMPGEIEALRAQHLIPDVKYKAIVDSCKIHVIKPDQKIYETAQGLADVSPSEILFIDDVRGNLTAADHLGWQVLWFNELNSNDSISRIRETLAF